MLMTRTTGHTMNRKERKAKGITGKKGDRAVINEALLLARKLQEKKKSGEANELYEKILEYDPDNIVALLDVGIHAMSNKNTPKAEKLFEKVLRLERNNVGGLIMLATIRMDQNRVDEALDLMHKAERRGVPRRLMNRIGVLYRDTGKLEKASNYVEEALKYNPDDVGALYTVQSLRKFSAEEFERLQRLANRPGIELEEKIRLEFALGKASLDHGKTEQAFWHFAEGNLLKRATFKFNIESVEDYLAHIPKIFNEEFRDKFRGVIDPDVGKNQIFIVGMPRSGSTLVDQIISSHPLVTSVGEAHYLPASMPVYKDSRLLSRTNTPGPAITNMFITQMTENVLKRIADKYLGFIAPYTKEQKIVVDKMLFNYVWVGVIRLALPGAKIIHTMRDPIDMGLSIWQLLFSDDMPWAYDQNDIGRYYLAYKKLMDHWRKIFPGEFLDVEYEDTVADQEAQSRRIIEFCGLEWSDDCLKFYENKRRVKTASVTQVRKPIYTDSVKKWKKYEKQMKRLIDTVEGTLVLPRVDLPPPAPLPEGGPDEERTQA